MKLLNAKDMVNKAYKGKYAIPHININNLEWTKAILLTAEKMKSPIIIGASEGAIKYMSGFKTVFSMVSSMVEDLNITVPVALHLDHGSFEGAKKAIDVGFTSVMYDGSHEDIDVNKAKSKEIIELAKNKNISVEVEVGSIGGEEDGIIGTGEIADPNDVKYMSELGADFIAAGIGNIHGQYPKEWKSLNFDVLPKLSKAAKKGIVLHGGSGIPSDQIKKAISLGVSKINVNTELQLENAQAIKDFVLSGKIDEGKNFDPRKLLAPGFEAMKNIVEFKINEFGSANKA